MKSQTAFRFHDLSLERPTRMVTETTAEFMELCQRSDVIIEAISVGKSNGQWIVDIRYVPGKNQCSE